jgi:hypothetical protein
MTGDVEYTPTLKGMTSIQVTLHRYHEDLDKHDMKLWASACAEGGTMTMINQDRQMSPTRDQIAINGLMGNGSTSAGGSCGRRLSPEWRSFFRSGRRWACCPQRGALAQESNSSTLLSPAIMRTYS